MEILLIITWYICLAASAYLFQKLTRCFSSWNTFTVFLVFVFMYHGIYVPFSEDVNFQVTGLKLPDSAINLWIANLLLMYVFVLVGVLFVNLAFRFNPGRLNGKIDILRKGINPALFWPVLVAVISLIIYKLSVATKLLSLMDFITRHLSAFDYSQARIIFSQSTASSQGALFYIANICETAALPFFIYFFYFAKGKGKNILYSLLFWFLLALYLYHGLISGQKGPALLIILGIFICFLTKRSQSLKFNIFDKKIIIFGFLIFFTIIPYLYTVQYPGIDYKTALHGTWFRLTTETNRGLQLYFYVYPDQHPFLNGASSNFFSKIMGYDGPPPHTYIAQKVFGEEHFTIPVIFIGDAWADFGFWGVILTSILVGILLQFYNIWFSRTPKTALSAGTYVALIVSAANLTSNGLPSACLTFGVASSFVLYLIVKERRLSTKTSVITVESPGRKE